MADVPTTDSSSTTPTETTPPTDQSQPNEASSSTTDTPPENEPTLLTPEPEDKAPEEKPKDDAGGDDEDGEDKGDKPSENANLFGAPEGDYEITGLPEGMTVDKAALEAVAPLAKKLNLSNEGMSELAGVYAEKVIPQVVQQVTEGIERDIAATAADWANQSQELVKTDGAFGGKPMNEVQSISAKAIDRFGGTEFREYLGSTGLGNHPAMVKFAYLVGQAISEDSSFERGDQTPKPKSRAEKFYGPQA